MGATARGALRGAARLAAAGALMVLYGLTVPLAWLPRLGKLCVLVLYADQQQPSAGLRLRRDEATVLPECIGLP